MPYNLAPFKPNQPYQDQVNTELNLANANFTAIGQAFMNNDPSQPVLRAVYINPLSPANPVANMLWFDTTDKVLKLYDGSTWKTVSGVSGAQFEELNNDVQSIKSSFLDKDPSKPVIRAVYVGSNAPANSAVGTAWLDTSSTDLVLKVYDGQEWKTALSDFQAVKTALNAEGEAPVYACRAWVNFNGTTSAPTIRASGNVSSVVRNGAGTYTINFTTPLPDNNYTTTFGGRNNDDRQGLWLCEYGDQNNQGGKTTTSLKVRNVGSDGQLTDVGVFMVAIFR